MHGKLMTDKCIEWQVQLKKTQEKRHIGC